MMTTATLSVTRSRAASFWLRAFGLSLIIAAAAHVSVPFWPVPMTLQTLAVLGIAGTCGARLGVAAMAAYLVEGALGAPVFAAGGGAAMLIGPTGGYLLGMVAAAGIAGRARTGLQSAGAIVVATAVIYAVGAGWLSPFVGPQRAISAGVMPFLAGDAVKGALAWAVAAAVRARA